MSAPVLGGYARVEHGMEVMGLGSTAHREIQRHADTEMM